MRIILIMNVLNARQLQFHHVGTYRESQMPSNQKHREAELHSVVQIVVIDDDRRAEDNPYRNDDSGRKLRLASRLRCSRGDRGRKDVPLGGFLAHLEHLLSLLVVVVERRHNEVFLGGGGGLGRHVECWKKLTG